MKTYKFLCIKDFCNDFEIYRNHFEKCFLEIKKDDTIDIYFGIYQIKFYYKGILYYFIKNINNSKFLSHFEKDGVFDIDKLIDLDIYICIKDNYLFNNYLIKEKDQIEILDYDDNSSFNRKDVISFTLNKENNSFFWNKEIDINIFHEHFITKQEYRNFLINKIIKEELDKFTNND